MSRRDVSRIQIQAPTVTEADRAKARTVVETKAASPDEALMLLQMLGLEPYESQLRGDCGTYHKYKNVGCRCDLCVAEYRRYERDLYKAREPKQHNVWAYKKGCRCQLCCADHTRWTREKAQRKKEMADG
jgi:hypothetical protein